MRLDPRPRLAAVVVLLIPADRCKSLLIDSKSFPVASRCFSLLPAAFPLLPAAFRLNKMQICASGPWPRFAVALLLVHVQIAANLCKSLLIDSKSFRVASRCFSLLPAAFPLRLGWKTANLFIESAIDLTIESANQLAIDFTVELSIELTNELTNEIYDRIN